MDILQLPFNKLIGLEHCINKSDGLLQLSDNPRYLNHLGTVHASALYSLAEASAGQFILKHINLDTKTLVPILRRAEIKYRKPAQGNLYSKGNYNSDDWDSFHETFARKKRALLKLQINILDKEDTTVAIAISEWLITENA